MAAGHLGAYRLSHTACYLCFSHSFLLFNSKINVNNRSIRFFLHY